VRATRRGCCKRARIVRRDGLNVLGALGLLVLDEVGLINHHAPEIKFGQPPHVAIENVVVHDKNIAERIELGAVPVNHSGATLGNHW
jgi:hypothetical protein